MASTATAQPAAKSISAADKKTILGFNPDWSAADKKAVAALVDEASDFKVNKGYIRLIADGKSLAWINPNHIDFPGSTPAKSLSTAKAADA
jgi:hypothetical protein